MQRKIPDLDPATLRWAAAWHRKQSKLYMRNFETTSERFVSARARFLDHAESHRLSAARFRIEAAKALTKTPKAARKRNG